MNAIQADASGMSVIVRDPMRQSNCSISDGKSKFQAMQCKAPNMAGTTGRIIPNKSPPSVDEFVSGA